MREIVARPRTRYSLTNITRKALSMGGMQWSPRLDSLRLLEGVDTVLSIGGDIYTLRENRTFDAAVPKFGDAALRRGVRYVLWGASIGPFTSNAAAERFFRAHLSRVSLIAAREPRSIAYLASIGVTANVQSCPDPAFFVAPEVAQRRPMLRRRPTIAVNLSPLSLGFRGVSVDGGVALQAGAVCQLVEEHDAEVVFVPHVVCPFSVGDDDVRYLHRIRRALPREVRRRVEILEGDPGFVGVKKALLGCDLVVAARMHCAINAVAAQVPTVFLAYSEKARGMAKRVYGHDRFVMDVRGFAPGRELSTAISSALEERGALWSALGRRLQGIRADPGIDAMRAVVA